MKLRAARVRVYLSDSIDYSEKFNHLEQLARIGHKAIYPFGSPNSREITTTAYFHFSVNSFQELEEFAEYVQKNFSFPSGAFSPQWKIETFDLVEESFGHYFDNPKKACRIMQEAGKFSLMWKDFIQAIDEEFSERG